MSSSAHCNPARFTSYAYDQKRQRFVAAREASRLQLRRYAKSTLDSAIKHTLINTVMRGCQRQKVVSFNRIFCRHGSLARNQRRPKPRTMRALSVYAVG